jgi:hypothetical protein
MIEGNFLDHPDLEQGNRSRMKIFRVNPDRDLPGKIITIILRDALDL